MLAQSFKTAEELGIGDVTHGGLIKVLGMLERGELKHTAASTRIENGFNMKDRWLNEVNSSYGCGSACCIIGWVDVVTEGVATFSLGSPEGLRDLFCPIGQDLEAINPAQAAIAVRSYLTTGHARWDEAMS